MALGVSYLSVSKAVLMVFMQNRMSASHVKLQGGLTIWYRMQPRLHTSLGRPTFMGGPPRMLVAPPRIASGDM
jgi:hypothetical protein